MTIKVYADRIEIGAKTITTTPTGIRIGDSLAANTQQQGYVSQANFTARELAYGAFGFQGSVAGFTAGGGPAPAPLNTINRFPFTADTNASDHGDLAATSERNTGTSSSTHGYVSGSYGGGNVIRKYPFASTSGSTTFGSLSASRGLAGLVGQSSSVSGYTAGGSPPFPAGSNVIDKFSFSTNAAATDVGDLTQGRYGPSGQSSIVSGYSSGGQSPSTINVIDKFPFSTDSNATDVGDLTQARTTLSGQSSTTHGYNSGGSFVNTIDKFPFSSDTNATDVGDLTETKFAAAGQSSTTHGYTTSGYVSSPPTVETNTIEKFPFSSDTNATDIGDTTVALPQGAGSQF